MPQVASASFECRKFVYAADLGLFRENYVSQMCTLRIIWLKTWAVLHNKYIYNYLHGFRAHVLSLTQRKYTGYC